MALIEPGEASAESTPSPLAGEGAKASETGAKVEPVAVAAQPDKPAQREIQSGQGTHAVIEGAMPHSDPEAMPPRTPPVAFTADELMPDKVPYASPAMRLFARELGVDLTQVTGTERGGRISKDDVQKIVKGVMQGGGAAAGVASGGGVGPALGGLVLLPWPKVDFSKFGETETRALSRIQKLAGANLARNWAMIPHVTQFDDADITELEALRIALNKENEKAGIKLTMLAFLIKASVAALQKYPNFNASLDATGENRC